MRGFFLVGEIHEAILLQAFSTVDATRLFLASDQPPNKRKETDRVTLPHFEKGRGESSGRIVYGDEHTVVVSSIVEGAFEGPYIFPRAKATRCPPRGRPDLPPPAEMTTNWRPSIM